MQLESIIEIAITLINTIFKGSINVKRNKNKTNELFFFVSQYNIFSGFFFLISAEKILALFFRSSLVKV